MNYQRIYDEFIDDRLDKQDKITGYYETHHILPRCMGGMDHDSNLIKLTFSDHLFAHQLLARIHNRGPYSAQMWGALMVMTKGAMDEEMKHVLRGRGVVGKKLRETFEKSKSNFVESNTGEKAMLADPTVYVFRHKSGEEFEGTRIAFAKHSGLSEASVNGIATRKTKKTACGWSIPTMDDPNHPTTIASIEFNKQMSGKKYRFIHMFGRYHAFTRWQFQDYTKLPWQAVHRIVDGWEKIGGWARI